jgi:hypothetical protein
MTERSSRALAWVAVIGLVFAILFWWTTMLFKSPQLKMNYLQTGALSGAHFSFALYYFYE